MELLLVIGPVAKAMAPVQPELLVGDVGEHNVRGDGEPAGDCCSNGWALSAVLQASGLVEKVLRER